MPPFPINNADGWVVVVVLLVHGPASALYADLPTEFFASSQNSEIVAEQHANRTFRRRDQSRHGVRWPFSKRPAVATIRWQTQVDAIGWLTQSCSVKKQSNSRAGSCKSSALHLLVTKRTSIRLTARGLIHVFVAQSLSFSRSGSEHVDLSKTRLVRTFLGQFMPRHEQKCFLYFLMLPYHSWHSCHRHSLMQLTVQSSRRTSIRWLAAFVFAFV